MSHQCEYSLLDILSYGDQVIYDNTYVQYKTSYQAWSDQFTFKNLFVEGRCMSKRIGELILVVVVVGRAV